ncbi:hypothetical protein NQZ68_008851 [Dissostichus eleginoides]|nr:hypothetical protein NQZ68_008851 [Dissostichus eleginoides]
MWSIRRCREGKQRPRCQSVTRLKPLDVFLDQQVNYSVCSLGFTDRSALAMTYVPIVHYETPIHQGHFLSRGQAVSFCAQRKVFLSGLRNLAGWAICTTRLAASALTEQ